MQKKHFAERKQKLMLFCVWKTQFLVTILSI